MKLFCVFIMSILFSFSSFGQHEQYDVLLQEMLTESGYETHDVDSLSSLSSVAQIKLTTILKAKVVNSCGVEALAEGAIGLSYGVLASPVLVVEVVLNGVNKASDILLNIKPLTKEVLEAVSYSGSELLKNIYTEVIPANLEKRNECSVKLKQYYAVNQVLSVLNSRK